ncbi:MAG: Gfo/Idh/MocA family oxidoreductase [Bacteroidetes bacterium]|nr:Gfo/Idh/MocA family oxidoreductase [Bacteroidota bacterium]
MLKVGIIGMGIRGSMYAKTISFNAYAEVTAVAEENSKRLAEATEQFGVNGYENYKTMLDENDFDIVVIALPDHLHREAVIDAAAKKCHMMIEKPLATSYEDAKVMVDAVNKAGVKALVGFENRWNPVFLSAKESIEANELEEIQFFHAQLNDSIFVPTEMLGWAADSTVGWFLFPHIVDLSLWMSGKKAKSVYASGQKEILPTKGVDTYDSITTIIEFEDGMVGTYSSSWIFPNSMPLVYDLRFEVVGSTGAIAVDCRDQMIHKMTDIYTHPGTLGREIYGKPIGFAAEMLNSFIDNVRLDTEPIVNIEQALHGVNVIDAVHRSIISGKVELVN